MSFSTTRQDINFAIPETKRPPIYTSMKYWGKKPHNVWFEYISNYVPSKGIFLDPFAGSGMSGIEAIRAGKRAICLDVNPLTTFVFEVYCTHFDTTKFTEKAQTIYNEVFNSSIYNELFCYEEGYTLHNTKYKDNAPYEVCFVSSNGKERFEREPTKLDVDINKKSQSLSISTPYPSKKFRTSIAYGNAFLKSIGNTYDCLFSKKNLAILSMLFGKILTENDEEIKKQLLFAFIQTVHLCCKMCVPRSKKTKRDYSTSWGRSAYFSAAKSMEMNPLLVFYNNCIGKQSVSSCLSYLKTYVGSIKGKNITDLKNIDYSEDVDLWYGIKDSRELSSFIKHNSVDFVLTDPPYGGLVPYLDLSYIWLAWLEIYNPIYNPDYSKEISVNDKKTPDDFRKDMSSVLSQIKLVSKQNAKIVLTFNNKENVVWKSLLGSILDSGYAVEKVIHQQNMRSGESNVVDKYGTSSTDFYIRCVDNKKFLQCDTPNDLQEYICELAEKIILERFEPTPYQILFNGIIANLSSRPTAFQNFDDDLVLALQQSNRFCTIENKDTLSGNYWWIKNKKYDATNARTLTNRIKAVLENLFSSCTSIKNEELLKLIYRKFPNGLSPDIVVFERLISEFATKKGVIWQRK